MNQQLNFSFQGDAIFYVMPIIPMKLATLLGIPLGLLVQLSWPFDNILTFDLHHYLPLGSIHRREVLVARWPRASRLVVKLLVLLLFLLLRWGKGRMGAIFSRMFLISLLLLLLHDAFLCVDILFSMRQELRKAPKELLRKGEIKTTFM